MAQAVYSDGHMRDGQIGTEGMGGARDEAYKPPLTESYEETKWPAGVCLKAKLFGKRLCVARFFPPGFAALFSSVS